MVARLQLPRSGLRRLRELAEAAWPHEACGMLEASAPGRVWRVHRLHNGDAEPWHRYTIDPEAYLRLEHAVRGRGHTLAGVWHSHPHGDPAPSARDIDSAWPGWHYVIAGIDGGRMVALRGWRIAGDRSVTPIPLHVPARSAAGRHTGDPARIDDECA